MVNREDLSALWASLCDSAALRRVLEATCLEDLGPADGPGDVTTSSLPAPDRPVTAELVARTSGVVAGLAIVPLLSDVYAERLQGRRATIQVRVPDGGGVEAGERIATLIGPLDVVLAVERPLLNLLGRLCGIATHTAACANAIAGTDAVICDTRKTTPGLRGLEKYAVACGGGTLHRAGLFDAALYKDNHLAAIAGPDWAEHLKEAIARARRHHPDFVEVEVDRLEQLEAIIALGAAGPDIVLLDNFTDEMHRKAVATRDMVAPSLLLEASGGITRERLRVVAETGVDRISIGALTHSVTALDIGLDMSEPYETGSPSWS